VLVRPVNDPPAPSDDSFERRLGEVLTFSEKELLSNDADVEGDVLVIAAVSNSSEQGAQVELAGGVVTYRPARRFFASVAAIQDIFTYQVCDASACATAAVNLTLRPVDRPAIDGMLADPSPFTATSECGADDALTVTAVVISQSALDTVGVEYRYRDMAGAVRPTRVQVARMRSAGDDRYAAVLPIGDELREDLSKEYTVFEYRVVAANSAGGESASEWQVVAIRWGVIC
jgi:hypothetical protein